MSKEQPWKFHKDIIIVWYNDSIKDILDDVYLPTSLLKEIKNGRHYHQWKWIKEINKQIGVKINQFSALKKGRSNKFTQENEKVGGLMDEVIALEGQKRN